MFTTRERFYRPPQHRQSLPLSHNPDSRVSKAFIVLCLPLSDFHGDVVSFTKRCYQSVKPANEYAGNCIRFSTSRFRSNLFLLRTYSQRKEDMKRKRKQKLLISKPYKVHHALQDYSITFFLKSCPHICRNQSILLSFSTYLLTRSRSSRHSASLDISLNSAVSSSMCSSSAASIFLLQSSDFPER